MARDRRRRGRGRGSRDRRSRGRAPGRPVPRARGPPAPTSSAACTATALAVTTDDGVGLHAEVDEVAPYAEWPRRPSRRRGSAGCAGRSRPRPTLVFVHGYALNLDCWHFQREYFRGKHRMVFYDQRSHGRSGPLRQRSTPPSTSSATTCGACSTSWCPTGRSCCVGHSMGGMTIMAFAERHPEVFDGAGGRRRADLHHAPAGSSTHRIVSRLIPDSIGGADRPAADGRPRARARARRPGPPARLEHRLPGRRPVRVRRGRARRRTSSSSTTCWRRRRSRCSRSSSRTSTRSTSSTCSRPSRDVPTHHHHRHQGRADLGRAQPQDGLADPAGHAGRVPRRRPHGDPRAEGPGQRGPRRPRRQAAGRGRASQVS